MSIAAFIRDTVFRPRLLQAGCMVVYDPDRRYHDLCLGLGDDRVRVIDASESSIESRQEAIMALREVGKAKREIDALVVYVPQQRTETDEEKQGDPFSIYAQIGAVFPRDDGDDYLSLCLRAKPDHATEIRRVFAGSPNGPPFAVIDAIGGGASWPQLRAALRVESGREILSALLAPSSRQADALKAQDGWSDEAREFLRSTLGMAVKTRGKSWTSIADELWRFVLFSEFVFDLPVSLPEALKGVPSSPIEAKPIIEDVCDQLRANPATRDLYIERAEAIEVELALPEQCIDIDDLGERDTFPFEERTFLKAAIKGISANETDVTRSIISRHKNSVWLRKGESQAQWELIRSGLALIECCDDNERELLEQARSQEGLIDFYLGSLREADRLQREFEQAVGEFLDHHSIMQEVIDQARSRYSRLSEKVQAIFVRHIESAGWPPEGRLANADVYDRILSERLKEDGRKVAYLLVDALRYELGVTLEKQLSEDGPVELHAAYAQLPTITLVGMASLLPGARTQLSLTLEGDVMVPKLGDVSVGNVTQRMDVFRKRLGDRFQEMPLSDFVRGTPRITSTVNLLVLRSTEIDSQLESNPETTLGLIPGTLKLIRVALHKLRGMGFTEAVIATDHGFFLNGHAGAGDVCIKPQGNWLQNAHDRALLGSGNADAHSVVINSEKLGIRGNYPQVALPKSMAPYRAGHLYFHGGASLSEAVVPVLVARLDKKEPVGAARTTVELTYKSGAKRITTRVPVVEIGLLSDDMFAQGEAIEVLIEAQDAKGNVVGEPRGGGDVNPATRTVTLTAGQRKQIALRMDPDFEGKFTIRVLNPTTLAILSALQLETDYTV
ncbi:PglZ domain-containing protein [Tabrizicola sp. BL-A-41-H6]|uniref:PglZ domain-containing protein n=1 Tax=Tabrizicola sp. BL-A-41-H6 TaxID=3421107 RepID=UPI003D668849